MKHIRFPLLALLMACSLLSQARSLHTVNDSTAPPLQAQFGWTSLTACVPQTMQFVDSSISSVGIASWHWDFGDGTTGTDQEPLHDYNANGSYTITFTVTDSLGNTSSATKTLVVNTPTPIVKLRNDTSVCEGAMVLLDAGVQEPDCQYYWSTGETTQTIQVTTTGDYWVEVYNATCAGFATVNIAANPQLAVSFTASQSGTCLPVSVQLTDQSASCGASVAYRRWNFDDGDSSLLQNPVHVYATGGPHTISLTERDNTGLEITTTQPFNVDINSNLVHLGNDTTICYGSPFILDAGNLGNQYLWNTGDTTHTLAVMNAGTYAVQVTKDGCMGWDTLVVSTVFPLVPAFGVDITSACLPVLVHFSDSTQVVCGASPLTGWNWDFGDGTNSAQNNPSHVYTKTGTYTVRLTVHNSLAVSDTVSKAIIIVTVGPVADTLPPATVCLGYSAGLDAGNEGARYLWTPAASLNNDTIESPMASPGVTTLFTVQITKCGVTVYDSAMVYVDSVARPVIELDGTLLMAQPGITYQWYKDGSLVSGATNRSYKPLTGGYYQVEISNTKGCFGKSGSYFFLPEGVVIPGSKLKVKISPNPSTGNTIHVLFSKIPVQPVAVNVYDTYGTKVYAGSCSSNVNTISCGQFHKGQYFVEVLTNGQRVVLPVQIL